MAYLYIVGTIVFTVYGQIIVKWRLGTHGALPEGLWDKVGFLLHLFLDPYIASGFVAGFISSLFWMAAMTKFDLSHAYPIIVGGLALLTTTIALVFLHEHMTVMKSVGLLCIVTGIYLVGVH